MVKDKKKLFKAPSPDIRIVSKDMEQFMELQSRNFSVLSLKCCYDDMVGGMALFSTHLFLQKSATNLLTTNLI